VAPLGQRLDRPLRQRRAGGGEQHDLVGGGVGAGLGDRRRGHVDADDHARAAAVGRVVDAAGAVAGEAAQVARLELSRPRGRRGRSAPRSRQASISCGKSV
jgi:hypothetical protein